jgi:hypothetical protein
MLYLVKNNISSKKSFLQCSVHKLVKCNCIYVFMTLYLLYLPYVLVNTVCTLQMCPLALFYFLLGKFYSTEEQINHTWPALVAFSLINYRMHDVKYIQPLDAQYSVRSDTQHSSSTGTQSTLALEPYYCLNINATD